MPTIELPGSRRFCIASQGHIELAPIEPRWVIREVFNDAERFAVEVRVSVVVGLEVV